MNTEFALVLSLLVILGLPWSMLLGHEACQHWTRKEYGGFAFKAFFFSLLVLMTGRFAGILLFDTKW
jgi:hypothetical protein